MSFDRVKPFAEAITGAHMGRTPSWARSLEVLRDVNTCFSRRGRRFGEGSPLRKSALNKPCHEAGEVRTDDL
jgi:hypothetical protein